MDGPQLAALLGKVAELIERKSRLAADLKAVNKELDDLEQLAIEQIKMLGLDLVRVAGKSWSVREEFYVSIPAANKDRVMEIAKERCPEMISVSTSSLKSWLKDNRTEGSESLTAGGPFEGLLSEHRELKLAHVTVG